MQEFDNRMKEKNNLINSPPLQAQGMAEKVPGVGDNSRKRKSPSDDSESRASKFHPETRICEHITFEALTETLASAKVIMLNSDEFKVTFGCCELR